MSTRMTARERATRAGYEMALRGLYLARHGVEPGDVTEEPCMVGVADRARPGVKVTVKRPMRRRKGAKDRAMHGDTFVDAAQAIAQDLVEELGDPDEWDDE